MLVSQSRRIFVWAPALLIGALLLCLVLASNASATGGTVRGWGYNAYAITGVGVESSSVNTPAPAFNLSEVIQATGGGEGHGLAVVADGAARAWGYNHYGQLGDGTTSNHLIAAPVPGLSNVIELA